MTGETGSAVSLTLEDEDGTILSVVLVRRLRNGEVRCGAHAIRDVEPTNCEKTVALHGLRWKRLAVHVSVHDNQRTLFILAGRWQEACRVWELAVSSDSNMTFPRPQLLCPGAWAVWPALLRAHVLSGCSSDLTCQIGLFFNLARHPSSSSPFSLIVCRYDIPCNKARRILATLVVPPPEIEFAAGTEEMHVVAPSAARSTFFASRDSELAYLLRCLIKLSPPPPRWGSPPSAPTVTLIVVFPQRGYRIKPTNNQKICTISGRD